MKFKPKQTEVKLSKKHLSEIIIILKIEKEKKKIVCRIQSLELIFQSFGFRWLSST